MEKKDLRIIFMGTPEFAVETLQALVEGGYNVVAVVTQPDKPVGRHQDTLQAPAVKQYALSKGLPVLQPVKMKDPLFIEELKKYNADIQVVVAFRMLPEVVWNMPKYGTFNVHAALLPQYRGAAPIQQAVIDGEKESGVTIMRMGTGLDTGDMISKIVVPIAKDETGGTLFDKLAEAGAKLLVETLPHIFDGTAVYEKQPEESPTPYAGMITKQMGLINFGKSAEELERLVRGLNPWPSAFTFWNGKTLKVWESFVVKSEETGAEKSEPGTVVKTDKKGIYVACGEDVLVLSQVQLEGKKRMDADAFLRGCHIETGSRFTDKKE